MTTVAKVAIDEQNPWPGLGSFDEEAERFFKGRANESVELRRMVRNAPLTVLFGASGLGKTSLVQAGLFPLLRKENYLPIYIRLDLREGSFPFIDQVKSALQAQCAAGHIDAPAMRGDESLWCYLHRAGLELWSAQNHLLTPVFVFDQFEEVFRSENRAAVTRLLIDLADLVENRLPKVVAETIRSNQAVGEALSLDHQQYKVLLCFREDFLPAVEGWKSDLPSILRNRLRLLPMSPQRAFEAVRKTAPHLVDANLAGKIVDFVAAAQRDEPGQATEELGQTTVGAASSSADGSLASTTTDSVTSDQKDESGKTTEEPGPTTESPVEPAFLSLVCQGLNEKRKVQHKTTFDADLLKRSGQSIIAEYYQRSVNDLPGQVRHFIQNELITERGFRKMCALDDARAAGVTDQDLQLLVNRRLLRFERQSGADQVELTHDLLTRVVREDRDREREKARVRSQRRRMGVVALVVASLAILASTFWWMYLQTLRDKIAAQTARDKLQKQTIDLVTTQKNLLETQGVLVIQNTNLTLEKQEKEKARHKAQMLADSLQGTLVRVQNLANTNDQLLNAANILVSQKEQALTDNHNLLVKAQELEKLQSARALAAAAMTKTLDHPLEHRGDYPAEALALAVYSISTSATREGLEALANALPNSELRAALDGKCGYVATVTFSDDTHITAAYGDGSTRQWTRSGDGYSNNSQLGTCKTAEAPALALSPDGSLLAISRTAALSSRGNVEDVARKGRNRGAANVGRQSVVDVRNVSNANVDYTLPTHWYVPTALAFSTDATHLAIGGGWSRRTVFDLGSKKELWTGWSQKLARLLTRIETATLGKPRQFVTRVAFSPNGQLLVFAMDDGIVEFWNVAEGKNTGYVRAHGASVETLAFSSNGEYLATGGRDNHVRIWELSAGTAKSVEKPVEGDEGHKDAVIALAFSPDSKFLATGSQDLTIKVWDVESGELLQTFTGHSGYITSLAFNQQGTLLSSGSRDGTVRVWDISSIGQVSTLAKKAKNLAKTAPLVQYGETNDSSVSGLMADVVRLGVPRLVPEQCKLYFPDEKCPPIAWPTN